MAYFDMFWDDSRLVEDPSFSLRLLVKLDDSFIVRLVFLVSHNWYSFSQPPLVFAVFLRVNVKN